MPSTFELVSQKKGAKCFTNPELRELLRLRADSLQLKEDAMSSILRARPTAAASVFPMPLQSADPGDHVQGLVNKFAEQQAVWNGAVAAMAELDALMSLAAAAEQASAYGPVCRPSFVAAGPRDAQVEASIRHHSRRGMPHVQCVFVEQWPVEQLREHANCCRRSSERWSCATPRPCAVAQTLCPTTWSWAAPVWRSSQGPTWEASPHSFARCVERLRVDWPRAAGWGADGQGCCCQVCLAALLAHVGALVPAKSLVMTPVDAIFVRMGARDSIISGQVGGPPSCPLPHCGLRRWGRALPLPRRLACWLCAQSTFFVELTETAAALNRASSRSLVALDELGRGTSTADGAAIASAVLTHLAGTTRCR